MRLSKLSSRISSLYVRISLMVALGAFGAAITAGLMVLAFTGDFNLPRVGILLVTALACAALTGSIGYAATRRMFRHLQRLSDAAARMATGDLATAIPVGGGDEIRTLARTLENARHELEGITRWLTHEKAWAEYLVDSISEGIVTLDSQNRITYMSRP